MIPRPSLRLPIWGALAIVGTAYLIRSLILRGGDFSLQLPDDAIALVALAVAVAFVTWVRHDRRKYEGSEQERDDRFEA